MQALQELRSDELNGNLLNEFFLVLGKSTMKNSSTTEIFFQILHTPPCWILVRRVWRMIY